MAFGLFPIIAALLRPTAAFASFSILVTGLIVIKHKGNIDRLCKGTESKMGRGRIRGAARLSFLLAESALSEGPRSMRAVNDSRSRID